jgi:hypothetical protein
MLSQSTATAIRTNPQWFLLPHKLSTISVIIISKSVSRNTCQHESRVHNKK